VEQEQGLSVLLDHSRLFEFREQFLKTQRLLLHTAPVVVWLLSLGYYNKESYIALFDIEIYRKEGKIELKRE
jgi:hypothetical protein